MQVPFPPVLGGLLRNKDRLGKVVLSALGGKTNKTNKQRKRKQLKILSEKSHTADSSRMDTCLTKCEGHIISRLLQHLGFSEAT